VLAAIGICPLAAMSGCPETASFVMECDQGSWCGCAGNRLVRPGLAAATTAPDPTRIGKSVLACVSSPVTGSAESRTFRFLTMWRVPRSSELPSTVRKDPVACFRRQHFG
jgi:hypothetical protein